jgi:hypothetical protein
MIRGRALGTHPQLVVLPWHSDCLVPQLDDVLRPQAALPALQSSQLRAGIPLRREVSNDTGTHPDPEEQGTKPTGQKTGILTFIQDS